MLNRVFIALIAVVLTMGFTFADCVACQTSQSGGQIEEQVEKETQALCSDCGQDPCVCSASEKVEAEVLEGEKMEAVHMKKMEGATMNAVFTAEALYTCPMHPEVVTDNADLKCPLCKMNLTKMSDEQVEKLKGSHPKGCVMCPIVMAGDSEVEKCPTCQMKLMEVKPEEEQEQEHLPE